MEETRNLVLEIANRLYDLDAEVYRVLGSGLGRVFNASREESIRELTQIMKEHRTSHYLRSSLALIGNMARTIPERQERSRVMTEYNEIWKLIQKLPDRFGAVDILDETWIFWTKLWPGSTSPFPRTAGRVGSARETTW